MRRALGILVAIAVLATAVPVRAWVFELGPDTRLNVMALIQAQVQFQERAAPDRVSWSKDFYLRRVRLILAGDVCKGISFFADTEQPNLGKGGNWDVGLYMSDVFVTFKVADEFMVDVGMMLLPFSRHGFQSAPGLNGIDFHLAMLKYPDGSHKSLRDAGVQIRGYAFGKRLGYRVGVFNGTQGTPLQRDASGAAIRDASGKSVLSSSPEDWPRFMGHARFNFLGTETEFFAKGITFGTTPTVSVGAGFDWQRDAVMRRPAARKGDGSYAPGALRDAIAATADVFVDVPFGKDFRHEAVMMAAFLWYDHGRELSYDKAGVASTVPSRNSGHGVLFEAGYRYAFLEPVLAVDWFDARQAGLDVLSVRGGLNVWIRNAVANVKMEFGGQKTGDLSSSSGRWIKSFTTQAQLFF